MTDDPLLQTLQDIAAFLECQKIPYALIGGLAVAVRGEPRSTLDVDVVIDCDVDRAIELLKNLTASHFKPLFDGVEEVVRTGLLLPLAHRETGIKVDLALGMSGFEQGAINDATMISLGSRSIPVVRAEHLIVMKQLASRPRDLDDISKILTRQGKCLDWPMVLDLARQLGQAIDDDLVGPLAELRRKREDEG